VHADRKSWIDTAELANIAAFGRRVNYLLVVAMNADSSLRLMDAQQDPSPDGRSPRCFHRAL